MPTSSSDAVVTDLIAANRILGHEGVLDALGHVSVRHSHGPNHFLMSQSRSPSLVEASDIMEFNAAGEPVDAQGRKPYSERYIHAAIFAARPDVNAVVHNHSTTVLPFSVTRTPLRPITHIGGILGGPVPVWDISTRFGDETDLLVVNMSQGADLASKLGAGPVLLMRGHGSVAAAVSIRRLVYIALALHREAGLLLEALRLNDVKYLSDGELRAWRRNLSPDAPTAGLERAWQYWCVRAGVPYIPADRPN